MNYEFQLSPSCNNTYQPLYGGGGPSAVDCTLEFSETGIMDIDNDALVDQRPLFDIIVKATDSAGLTQDMVLQFSIRNLNDEYPIWENEPYRVSVNENTERGEISDT